MKSSPCVFFTCASTYKMPILITNSSQGWKGGTFLSGKKKLGFTLIEMLLAAALSCILLYGLMRIFISVTKYVDVLRETATVQRTVGMTFYQMRTDLGAAFVPESLNLDETKEEKDKRKKELDQLSPEKKEAVEREQFKPYFLLSTHEQDDAVKIDGVRRHLLKQLSFVTTNPLHVYAQKQPCIVRVSYELEKNKKLSTRAYEVFTLVRKEVTDIANAAVQEAQRDKDTINLKVQRYVIADNLRGAYVACELLKQDIPRKKGEAEKEFEDTESLQSATWGDREPLQGIVPRTVTVWLDCWQGEHIKSVRFCQTVAIKSYPTQHQKPEVKKPAAPAQQASGVEENQEGQQSIRAMQQTVSVQIPQAVTP